MIPALFGEKAGKALVAAIEPTQICATIGTSPPDEIRAAD
jgi:hypothetical protein